MLPPHLKSLADSLSHCSEQKAIAFKAKNVVDFKHWSKMILILTHACRDIGKENHTFYMKDQ